MKDDNKSNKDDLMKTLDMALYGYLFVLGLLILGVMILMTGLY